MEIYIYWFILALVLLALEMSSGTFYLLVLATAMAVGGIAALIGLGFSAQLALSALASIVGIILIRRWKSVRVSDTLSQNLDIGQTVRVLTWHDDGSARVFFRGTEWDAVLEKSDSSHEGTFYIKAMRSSTLVLTHDKPV